ncbi:MAG: DUF2911 domain-containing protein [Gemmatimonadales bacterium]
MSPFRRSFLVSALVAGAALPAAAQQGVIVYRLGRDTVALEKFSRTRQSFSGEMVTRSGAAVIRTEYEIALDRTGWPTSAVVRRVLGNGAPIPNNPTEYRLTFGPDSATRTLVWPDSTSTRSYRVARGFPAMPVFVYAPLALLRGRAGGDSTGTLGPTGNPGYHAFESAGGDTVRLRGAPYAMRLRFDRSGLVSLVDGTFTTNKSIGTRSDGPADLAAIGERMTPTGVLSPRITAQATLMQAPIMINYGSPSVRGRTVWGGTLIPYDSVWRTGANEATHLANAKRIQLGDLTLEPGLYTLWLRHTRAGTFLVVNRQVGQWGTAYDPAQDIGQVRLGLSDLPDFAETFEIRIRTLARDRGAIDLLFGDKMASAEFTVLPGR